MITKSEKCPARLPPQSLRSLPFLPTNPWMSRFLVEPLSAIIAFHPENRRESPLSTFSIAAPHLLSNNSMAAGSTRAPYGSRTPRLPCSKRLEGVLIRRGCAGLPFFDFATRRSSAASCLALRQRPDFRVCCISDASDLFYPRSSNDLIPNRSIS